MRCYHMEHGPEVVACDAIPYVSIAAESVPLSSFKFGPIQSSNPDRYLNSVCQQAQAVATFASMSVSSLVA